MDPELEKFKAGSGSGINHSGSATLELSSVSDPDPSINPNQRGIGGKPPTFVQNDFTP